MHAWRRRRKWPSRGALAAGARMALWSKASALNVIGSRRPSANRTHRQKPPSGALSSRDRAQPSPVGCIDTALSLPARPPVHPFPGPCACIADSCCRARVLRSFILPAAHRSHHRAASSPPASPAVTQRPLTFCAPAYRVRTACVRVLAAPQQRSSSIGAVQLSAPGSSSTARGGCLCGGLAGTLATESATATWWAVAFVRPVVKCAPSRCTTNRPPPLSACAVISSHRAAAFPWASWTPSPGLALSHALHPIAPFVRRTQFNLHRISASVISKYDSREHYPPIKLSLHSPASVCGMSYSVCCSC